MKSLTLSVIIPCINEERRLEPTLRALLTQLAAHPSVDVLVVDGGSTDRTTEIAQHFGVRVVQSERGVSRQRNVGAATSDSEWLVFLDADCTITPCWLESALAQIERQDTDFFGGPSIVPPYGTWVERAWGKHLEMRCCLASRSREHLFRFITASNMFISRSMFTQVGGFDENLTSGEDTFLGYKVWRTGGRLAFCSKVVVYHRGEPKNLRAFFVQQVWHSNREVWRRMTEGMTESVGQNAYKYGLIHLGFFCLLGLSLWVGLLFGRPLLPFLSVLAWFSLPLILAGRAAIVTNSAREVPSLVLLYWLYGVARATYLLGLTKMAHKTQRF